MSDDEEISGSNRTRYKLLLKVAKQTYSQSKSRLSECSLLIGRFILTNRDRGRSHVTRSLDSDWLIRLTNQNDFEHRRSTDSTLSLPIEFDSLGEFETLIRQAIKVVLGESGAAKEVEIGDYDYKQKTGCIFVEKGDFRLIWAALSVYGSHFGTDVAIRLQKLFEIKESDSN